VSSGLDPYADIPHGLVVVLRLPRHTDVRNAGEFSIMANCAACGEDIPADMAICASCRTVLSDKELATLRDEISSGPARRAGFLKVLFNIAGLISFGVVVAYFVRLLARI